VDDILVGATNNTLYEEFFALMNKVFEMSMIGELNFFLGLQINQCMNGICIIRSKYIMRC